MKALYEYLEKIPKTVILLMGVALVILLGAVDRLTGYELSFSIFYLLPVSLVAWFDKRSHAVIISVFSAAIWMLADLTSGHTYSHLAIPVWNSITRLGFFLVAAFSLSAIKKLLVAEQSFARIDFLTGITNSRAFHEIAKIEIERSGRFSRPITIAYIDIDNFKQVNDTLGHSKGDNLLHSVANTIKDNIRTIDTVSRLGGDEFAILFPETNAVNAKTAINKVREELLGLVKYNNWPITFSVGVVTCYSSCNLDEFIREADNLMYKVKRSGKNSVEFKIHEMPISNS